MSVYYRMKDLNMIGKQEQDMPYIYDMENQTWKEDENGLFAKRLDAFDGTGSGLEEISEEKAMELLKRYNGEM